MSNEIKLSELEKLRIEYEKKFAVEGSVEHQTVYNTDYLSDDCTLVDVWDFFIENIPKIVDAKFSVGTDRHKHERLVNAKIADVTFTQQEIYNLAVFAGFRIDETNSTDDRDSEIIVKEDMTVKMNSGKDWKGRGAYYADYPEDGGAIIREK